MVPAATGWPEKRRGGWAGRRRHPSRPAAALPGADRGERPRATASLAGQRKVFSSTKPWKLFLRTKASENLMYKPRRCPGRRSQAETHAGMGSGRHFQHRGSGWGSPAAGAEHPRGWGSVCSHRQGGDAAPELWAAPALCTSAPEPGWAGEVRGWGLTTTWGSPTWQGGGDPRPLAAEGQACGPCPGGPAVLAQDGRDLWVRPQCLERGCLGGSPDSELPADVGNASICADRRGKSYLTLSSRCDGNTGRHKGTGRRVSDQPAQPAATVCLGQPGPPTRERTHHTPWRDILRRPPVREGGCIPTGSDLGIPWAPVPQASGPQQPRRVPAQNGGLCPWPAPVT